MPDLPLRPTDAPPAPDASPAFEAVYDELRALVRRIRRRHRPDDAFNTTALVHEAHLKLDGVAGAEKRRKVVPAMVRPSAETPCA